MSYCVSATVAKFAGIAVGLVDSVYTGIADDYVEHILGFDLDAGAISRTQYFDLENRNDFYVEYDASRDFDLDRFPLIDVQSVTYNPDEDGAEVLTVNDDYFINTDSGIIKLSKDFDARDGVRKLKVVYTYGYTTVPQIIKDFASMYAAMLHELKVPISSAGYVLKEVEIGRYRELYDTANTTIKSKYSLLQNMEKSIISKYKIWE